MDKLSGIFSTRLEELTELYHYVPLPNSFHLPCATSGSRLSRNKSIGTVINFPEHPTTNLNYKLVNRILDESLRNQINILSNTCNFQQFLNTEYVCVCVGLYD